MLLGVPVPLLPVHKVPLPLVTSNQLPFPILIWISFPFPLKFGILILKTLIGLRHESSRDFLFVCSFLLFFFHSRILKNYFLKLELKYPVVKLYIGIGMTVCNVLHHYSFCLHSSHLSFSVKLLCKHGSSWIRWRHELVTKANFSDVQRPVHQDSAKFKNIHKTSSWDKFSSWVHICQFLRTLQKYT